MVNYQYCSINPNLFTGLLQFPKQTYFSCLYPSQTRTRNGLIASLLKLCEYLFKMDA